MSEYTPALSQLEFAYQETQERLCGTNPFVASAEFERAISEVAKAAKAGLVREIEIAIENAQDGLNTVVSEYGSVGVPWRVLQRIVDEEE